MTKTATKIITLIAVLLAVSIPLFFLGSIPNTANAETYYYQTNNEYNLYAQAKSKDGIEYGVNTQAYTKNINFAIIYGYEDGMYGAYATSITKRITGSGNDERVLLSYSGYMIKNGIVTNHTTSGNLYAIYTTTTTTNENYHRVYLVYNVLIFDTVSGKNSFFSDPNVARYFDTIPYQYVTDSSGSGLDFDTFWDDYVYDPLKYWYETALYNYNDKYDLDYSFPPESWEDYNVCQTALAELCSDMEIEISALEADNERLATAYAPYAAMDFVTGIFTGLGNILNLTIGPIPLYAFIAIPLILGIIYLVFRLLR